MKIALIILISVYVLLAIFVGIWCKRIHDLLKKIELTRERIVGLLTKEKGQTHGTGDRR